MSYRITYYDNSHAMISSNNPTLYDPNSDGVITLSAPTLTFGEFRGWYLDSEFQSSITQLSSSTISGNTNIYANIQVITQLQVLGSSITQVTEASTLDGKYMLMTNSLDSLKSRELLGISPQNYSGIVTGRVKYGRLSDATYTADLDSMRQEYFLDMADRSTVVIDIENTSSQYIVFHFTRGTNCNLDNLDIVVTVNGITVGSSASNSYDLSIGSTLIFDKSSGSWVAGVYLDPSLTSVTKSLVNESLEVRNYVYTGVKSFPVQSSTFGGRNSLTIQLSDLNLTQSESDVLYKSIIVQFDSSSYSVTGANAAELNNKQGYLNLIDVEAAKLTYNLSSNTCTLTLTYDAVPAYLSTTLSSYTSNIPIRIMVVI